jgi:hypothetical protein
MDMKQLLSYLLVIKNKLAHIQWYYFNTILIGFIIYLTYFTVSEVDDLRVKIKDVQNIDVPKVNFSSSIELLRDSIDEVFLDNQEWVVNNHKLKVVSKFDDCAVVAESILQLEIGYRDVIEMVKALALKNALGRIAFLQMEKQWNKNKLLVGMKTYHVIRLNEKKR